MQQTMRTTSVMRFVLYGAVGFGIGWAIAGLVNVVLAAITAPTLQYGSSELPPWWATWLPHFTYFIAGACGGAGLGLAIGGWKRVVALAVAGGVGFGVSFFLFFIVAFLFGLREVGVAMGIGLFGGVMLGLALADQRRVILLGLAGMVGFGIGGAIATALGMPFAIYPFFVDFAEFQGAPLLLVQHVLVQAMVGLIGGASLGAALGYLENRRVAEVRRPRVL